MGISYKIVVLLRRVRENVWGSIRSYVESGFRRSFQGSTRRERRQKRHEEMEDEERQSSLGKGSFQTYWTMSGTSGRNCFNRRDEELEQKNKELECLSSLVGDLELQARGRCQRRDHKD